LNLEKICKVLSNKKSNNDRFRFILRYIKIFLNLNPKIQVISDFEEKYGNKNIIISKNKGYPLICAHYDTVLINGESSPGVNDNGSGIACLLNLIYLLGDKNVDFAFFGGEEMGYIGADFYLSSLKKYPKWVLNLDTCGLCDDLGVSIPSIVGDWVTTSTTEWMNSDLIELTRGLGLNYCQSDWTAYGDHLPFLWQGIDSTTIQGQDLNYYGLNEDFSFKETSIMHTLEDTKVDVDFMKKIIDISYNFTIKNL
jgi:Zn-dependent M28 family amino/carboxypeptidase